MRTPGPDCTKPAQSWPRRIAIFVIAAVASLYVAYVVGINVFLSTSLFERVINNASPEQIEVTFRRGWSIFPGTVHARDLVIRGADSNIEWLLTLDRVEFDLSLAGLAHRRFAVSRARGTGVTFRVRQKLPRPPVREEEYIYLPPIADLGPFAVRPGYVFDYDKWLDRYYESWTISLEDVVAEHVREVWVDQERFEGDARVSGRFYLKPARSVNVGPCQVVISRGAVLRGPRLLAASVAGRAGVTIETFDPRLLIDMNHRISVSTDLRMSVPDVGELARGGLEELRGSAAVFMASLRLVRGVFADGTLLTAHLDAARATARDEALRGEVAFFAEVRSRMLWVRADLRRLEGRAGGFSARIDRAVVTGESPSLDLAAPLQVWKARLAMDDSHVTAGLPASLVARARVDLHGELASEDLAGHGKVTVETRRLRLARGRSPVLSVGRLRATVTAPRWTPDASLQHTRIHIRVEDGGVQDIVPLNRLLPQGAKVALAASPSARFSGELEAAVDGRIARGKGWLHGAGLGVSTARLRAVGDVDASARVSRLDLGRGTAAVEDFKLTLGKVIGSLTPGRRDFTVARLDLSGAAPALDLHRPSLKGTDLHLAVTGAEVADARVLGPLVPGGMTVEGGRVSVAGKLDLSSSERDGGGVFTVGIDRAAIRVGGVHLGGDAFVRVVAGGYNADTGELDLSGSRIVLRDVVVSGAPAPAPGWRGDLAVKGGLLRLDGRPRLDAQLALAATDARPILALVVKGTLPKLLVGLIDMPDLRARATLGAGEGEVALRRIDARGDNLQVRGDYVSRGGKASGLFTIDKDPFRFRWRVGSASTSPSTSRSPPRRSK